MIGKRTEKKTWTLPRLLGVAVLLAALALLPTLSDVMGTPPAEETAPVAPPPVEEQTSPADPEPPPAPEPEPQPEPEPEPEPYPNPDKPMIALTFDDGPSDYTPRLLDIFAQHGGKGTFFMVGQFIGSFPDTVRRSAEEGHEMANHSWSHKDLAKLGKADIEREILKCRQKILDVAGVETKLVRLPYGSSDALVRTVAAETESTLVRWTVDPQDWKFRNADTVYNAVMDRVKDGSIVLVHDIHPTTIDAMERLIPDLQSAGYQLVTVSELLEYRAEAVSHVVVYPPEPEPEPAPEPPAPPAPDPAPAPVTPAPAPAPVTPDPAPVPETPAPPDQETPLPEETPVPPVQEVAEAPAPAVTP